WIVTDDAEPFGSTGFPEAHSDILFLQYTSGSTNDPKGVMVSHRNILSNCDAVVDHTPVGVSWLPQYHDMGLIAFYMFTAIKGGTTYGCSPMDFLRRPALWLEAMSRYRATASAAPNFAYAYCLRRDKVGDENLQGLDLSALRLLLNGAEPVKAEVYRDFLRRFEPYGLKAGSLSAAYGLAEYTLAVSGHGREVVSIDVGRLTGNQVSPAQPTAGQGKAKDLVSCGRPLGATQVKIVDVSRSPREAPEGRVGEVWVTGPSRCLGYWGRPELTQQVFEARLDGERDAEGRWLRTGDLGFMRDGELFICGRAKDILIVRGANYYPQDIEAIVEEDPAVRRGCVAAFGAEEDGTGGVVVVAELRNGRLRPDTRTIHRTVRQRLGIAVDLFLFIPKRTIPKTSSGKISRHRAYAKFREDGFKILHRVETSELPDSGPHSGALGEASSSREPRVEPLARLFRKYGLTGEEDLTLVEAGLDSLALVDFAVDLEKLLVGRGASDLAEGVEVRWLQKIPISELFQIVAGVSEATPRGKLRFRQAFAALRREHLETERRMMRRDSRLAVDPSPAPRVGADLDYDPGGILLTAGTGFFGPFLLWSLLEQCDDPIYVLVRARDVDQGRERLEEGLASLGLPMEGGPVEGWQRRVVPVCGDLSKPLFGMSTAEWKLLCRRIHTVYHNGALVNYLLDYGHMRDTNVGATREVIRFASTGRPKVVNHISTTFVFGWSSKETLFERDTNPEMELLDFGYSQSKWVSEQLILDAMDRGLPARVFRPALIVPSERGGGHNFDITIRMLAFMLDHGISTTAENQVSLTPADVAANNIVAISSLPDTLGETFHVTRDDFATLRDVTETLGDLTQTRFAYYPIREFVPIMIERCRKGDLLFPLVNFLVHSVDNITAMEFKRYDSSNYQRARDRSPAGMPDPPLVNVVAGILRFMGKHGILEDRKAELLLQRH
ncbi:MAG: AMP-binding protein, partial [Gemmatimonadota bacterium]